MSFGPFWSEIIVVNNFDITLLALPVWGIPRSPLKQMFFLRPASVLPDLG